DLSNGVTQVAAEIFEQTYATGIPVRLLHLIESAHFQPRAAHPFVVRQAVRDIAVDESFPVKTELIVQLLFHGAAPNKRPKPVSEIGEHRCLRYTLSGTCARTSL